ncbi:aconitase X swivel domain-containing protein [Methanopyrus sp.]
MGVSPVRCEPVVDVEKPVEAEALVSSQRLSFLGGVDPKTGDVIDPSHELYGEKLTDRVLILPGGRGSTVGSYVLMEMSDRGTAPAGIVVREAEPILVVGCVLGDIPLFHRPERDLVEELSTGDVVKLLPGGKVEV